MAECVEALLAGGGLDALLQEIRRSAVESRVGLVVLDSLTSLYNSHKDPDAVRCFLTDLGSALFVLGCTAILVQGQYSVEHSLAEQVIADDVILMDVSAEGAHEDRRLRISKMRGSKHLYGLHHYELTQAGLSLHPHE